MHRVCMKFDIYWSPEIRAMVVKEQRTNSRMRNYISKTNLINFIDKTYDDTLDEEAAKKAFEEAIEKAKEEVIKAQEDASQDVPPEDPEPEETKPEEVKPNLPVKFEDIPDPTPETIDFWGPGFTPDVYFDLDRRYKKWTSDKGSNIDESSAALYKQICLCEVNIAKNMMAGKPIESAQKSMNELLGSLNAKPVQKKQDEAASEAANETFDNMPFGMGIKMCENTRPIPKPDPRFDDVDGIVRYISVWFLGHLCKMLGIRNTYCKLYEDEIERLRIERPGLETEDDESVFNDIFGDDVNESDG